MRRWLFVLLIAVIFCPHVDAHIDDESRQAFATLSIADEAVEVVVTLPARYAFPVLLDGASPVELDKLEPGVMAARIEPVLAPRNPVTIDGVAVRPLIEGTVTDMMNSRLPPRAFPEPQVMQYGQLMYVARYETKTPARRVSLRWDMFVPEYNELGEPVGDGETSPVVVVLKVDGKQQLVVLTKDEPEFVWHSDEVAAVPADLRVSRAVERNFIRVPALSIGIVLLGGVVSLVVRRTDRGRAMRVALVAGVGAVAAVPFGQVRFEHTSSYARLSEAEKVEVFRSLHANIYRAFDYTDEGAVYDALAQSVDGPMLETIYNDVYQSLIMRDEGGAVSKVVRVDVQAAELVGDFASDQATPGVEEQGAFLVRADWQVDGLVRHHGHTHERTNAFEAVYTVAPRSAGWRIVEAQILDQRRVDGGGSGAGG